MPAAAKLETGSHSRLAIVPILEAAGPLVGRVACWNKASLAQLRLRCLALAGQSGAATA